MTAVKLTQSDPLFMTEVLAQDVQLEKEDYLLRLHLLVERMKQKQIDHVILYGDREHFSNIEYFTSYDCRFEEGVLIVSSGGEVSLLAGNEGLAYSEQIPYPIQRFLYQNFSLQGQPRDKVEALHLIFEKAGVTPQSKVGLVGLKYFETDCEGDPAYTFDVPAFLLAEIYCLCKPENVVNFAKELTGYPNGIRIKLHSAKEIAWAEYAGCRAANAVQKMLKQLKPGVSEYELSAQAGAGLEALNVHPMINFGAKSVSIGLKSPLAGTTLSLGDVCGICYSVRGNLTSKIAVAAYDLNSYHDDLKPYFESFYKKHFAAMAGWYEHAGVGRVCGEMYDAVYREISHEEHGITLNPGHSTGTEEWLNSAFYKGSQHKLQDGEFLQADIIASGANPVRTSICEDAVVIASETLRAQLLKEFPQTAERIRVRQMKMREVLGIQISDDVLPMSNLNGVFYPFMLNLNVVFAVDGGQ